MENSYGSINPNDIATLSLLGRGSGYGYENFHGDGSAINANVRGNRDLALLESVNANTRDQFLSSQIRDGDSGIKDAMNINNQFLTDRINSQGIDFKFQSVSDQLASAERLAFANQAATDRRLGDIDLKLTECCCELKAGQAAIMAKIDADRVNDSQREADNLRLQIQINNQSRGNG